MRQSGAPTSTAHAWAPWGCRLSDLGYASALYDAVFGGPDPEARGALSAQVHRVLWTRIVDRDLLPGTRFFEDDIAALVGVSRVPVRDAVARLVEDGLLVRTGRGIQVRAFRPDEVRALYEYRALLECYATRRAAAVLKAEDLAPLRAEQERLLAALQRPEPRYVVDFLLADLRLHDTILAACANGYVVAAMRRIRGQLSLFQTDGMRRERDVRSALDEHLAILLSLGSGDGEEAARAMERHILGVSRRVRTVMGAGPEGGPGPPAGEIRFAHRGSTPTPDRGMDQKTIDEEAKR
jgi:DNA-binding GntR family transcriptional regulator